MSWHGKRSSEWKKQQSRTIKKWHHERNIQSHIIKLNKKRRGQPFSKEHRRKLSEAHDRHDCLEVHKNWKRRTPHGDGCLCPYCAPGRTTDLERALEKLLGEYPTVIREQWFGRYRVDAYLPEYNLIFEADGSYWHRRKEDQDPGYHQRRDEYIMKRFGKVVIHLTPGDLAPWL